jgi:hypothetical protein
VRPTLDDGRILLFLTKFKRIPPTLNTHYAAAAMALQPVSSLSLLYALPPEFSIFGFSFPSPYPE